VRGEGEPEPVEENDVEETMEASLQGIRVEPASGRSRRQRPYDRVVGLGLAEEYKDRWKEIAQFRGNLKRLEGMTPKEMQQFRQEPTNHLVSDRVLDRKQNTNELPV
jgi:hypothetical protein